MSIPPATIAAIPDAVDALLKWKTTQSNLKNPQLLPQDEFVYLNLTLKKIPQKARTNPYKIPLPYPLIPPNSFSEICIIIDDRPNSEMTSAIAKEKIKSEEISLVSKVIKLSKLKTDYKPFESKRKLCDSYDLFFADKRVIPLLPKLLGKHFFAKKKLPLGINLAHKNWKEQIERGCSSGLLFFSTGTCSVIRVAKISMGRDEIVENVIAAVNGVVEFVPKKLGGVRSFHLKFLDSVALPLYQSLPDVKLRIEGKKDVEGDDLVEVVEVGKKSKSKKRIHEVNHDDEGGEIENEDLVSVEQVNVVKPIKKKRKGGVVEVGKKKVLKEEKINEVNDDEDENDDLGSLELDDVKPKKKKDGLGKKKTKRGKIVEVNHDDDDDEDGENENEDLVSVEQVDVVKPSKNKRKGGVVEVGKKKVSKKGKINEVNDGEDENDDLGGLELDDVKPKKKKDGLGKKKAKKEKSVEVNHDVDEENEEIEDVETVSVAVKEKKRKGNVVEENDVKLKSSDKKGKTKQNGGESGKKEKKKGRSVSRY